MDITDDSAVPLTKQLMNDYEETHASTIAVMPVPHEEVSAYGVIIAPQGEGKDGLLKPSLKNQRLRAHQVIWLSSIISPHRRFSIFLENQKPGAGK